jgi:hypothetical protein
VWKLPKIVRLTETLAGAEDNALDRSGTDGSRSASLGDVEAPATAAAAADATDRSSSASHLRYRGELEACRILAERKREKEEEKKNKEVDSTEECDSFQNFEKSLGSSIEFRFPLPNVDARPLLRRRRY